MLLQYRQLRIKSPRGAPVVADIWYGQVCGIGYEGVRESEQGDKLVTAAMLAPFARSPVRATLPDVSDRA